MSRGGKKVGEREFEVDSRGKKVGESSREGGRVGRGGEKVSEREVEVGRG